MRCELCGSKKDVRRFYAPLRRTFYSECRKCFEEAFVFGCKMGGLEYTQEDMEAERNSGKEIKE